eukprot:TRINITY_DN5799_c0_g1_i1.p1 TRINITY_DN5799_c0_g1~~TRINITY_DN5799_c0_g1_i1.p1  ORF type:complete len:1475 (-),score=383.17 TRINITY_DN5799_c0_g1_i1:283-4707(-)
MPTFGAGSMRGPAASFEVNFVSFAGSKVVSLNSLVGHERMAKLAEIANAANPNGPTSLDSVAFMDAAVFQRGNRLPTFAEARDASLLIAGSDLPAEARVLFVSHRWLEHTSAGDKDTLGAEDDEPIVVSADTGDNLNFNLIRLYLEEALVRYTHVWMDACCIDAERLHGPGGTSQVDSSLLALLRSSALLVVPRVITNNERTFSDLKDMTSRAWVRLEVALAISAGCETVITCLCDRDVTYLTMPATGAVDKCMRIVADKFKCWPVVRRHWDRLWQPLELLSAANDVMGGEGRSRKRHAPMWLSRQVLALKGQNLGDFEAAGTPSLGRLLSCLGMCSHPTDKAAVVTLLLRGLAFLRGQLSKSVEDLEAVLNSALTEASLRPGGGGVIRKINSFSAKAAAAATAQSATGGLSVSAMWQLEKARSLREADRPTAAGDGPPQLGALAAGGPLVYAVDLRWAHMGPLDITRLRTMLPDAAAARWPQQRVSGGLLLDGNAVTGAAAAALLSADRFSHLGLGCTGLGDGGAVHAGRTLAAGLCKAIVSLDLSWCGIGAAGVMALSAACTGVGSLRMLKLDGNAVTNHGTERAGMRALAKAIAAGPLQCVSLCSAGLDVADALSLSTALSSNPPLSHLALGDNVLGAEGGAALARALTTNTALRALDLSFCSLGSDVALDGWDVRVQVRARSDSVTSELTTPRRPSSALLSTRVRKSSSVGTIAALLATPRRKSRLSSATVPATVMEAVAEVPATTAEPAPQQAANPVPLSKAGSSIAGRALTAATAATSRGSISHKGVLCNTTLKLLDVTGSTMGSGDAGPPRSDRCETGDLVILSEWTHDEQRTPTTGVSPADRASTSTLAASPCTPPKQQALLALQQQYQQQQQMHTRAINAAIQMLEHLAARAMAVDDPYGTEAADAATAAATKARGDWEHVSTTNGAGQSRSRSPSPKRTRAPGRTPELARLLEQMGRALATLGDLRNARVYLQRALAIREDALGPRSPETAAYLLRLSVLQAGTFDTPRAAEVTLKRCLAASEEFFGAVAAAARHQGGKGFRGNKAGVAAAQAPRTLSVYPAALSSLGLLLMDQDRLEEAKGFLSRALDADRALYGRDHPEVAEDLTNLAYLICCLEGAVPANKGGMTLAEKFLRRALEVFEAARRQGRCNAATLANAVNNVAAAVRTRGALDEAAQLYRRALLLRTSTAGPFSPSVVPTLVALASTLTQDATQQLQAKLDEFRRQQVEDALELRRQMDGSTHHKRTPEQEAEERAAVEKALLDAKDRVEEQLEQVARDLVAEVSAIGSRLHEARDRYGTAVVIVEKQGGRQHPMMLDLLSPLASVLFMLDEVEEAIQVEWDAAELLEDTEGPESLPYLKAMVWIGWGLMRLEDPTQARNMLDEALGPLTAYRDEAAATQDGSWKESDIRELDSLVSRGERALAKAKQWALTPYAGDPVAGTPVSLSRKGSMRSITGKLMKWSK